MFRPTLTPLSAVDTYGGHFAAQISCGVLAVIHIGTGNLKPVSMRTQSMAFTAGQILWAGTMLCSVSAAYARPDTRAMTCAQTQALIKSNHAAVLTTGPNTYDRFVRQFGNECDWPEVPVSTAVPTKDGECRVYRCEEPINLPD